MGLADSLWFHQFQREHSSPEKEAEQAGWIKITSSVLGKDTLIMHEDDTPLTRQQKRTVVDWCNSHGVKLPYWMQEV